MENITTDQLAGMIKEQFDEVGKRFDEVDKKFDEVNKQFGEVNGRLGKIESNMLTKDYLDERLADLRGDLVVLTRKEDNKLKNIN